MSTRLVSLREVRTFPAKCRPRPPDPAPEALLLASRAPWGQLTRSLLLSNPTCMSSVPPPVSQRLCTGTSHPVLTQACPLQGDGWPLLPRLAARRGGSTGPYSLACGAGAGAITALP